MAKRKPNPTYEKAWQSAQVLYNMGSPMFVNAIRLIPDAERVAAFAEAWYYDSRPAAKELLKEYLSQPLNALRHEPLVKRIFKFAEEAGDDEIMAHYLVAFDRNIRRKRNKQSKYDQRSRRMVETETLVVPAESTLPNDDDVLRMMERDPYLRRRFEKILTTGQLFSLKTRRYLRRRAWRYFRKLGRTTPERYVAAVSMALNLYRDEDIKDGVGLLDSWGLLHILYHHSEVIESHPTGWKLVPGKTLAALSSDPMFADLWKKNPSALVGLLSTASARVVRRWSIGFLKGELRDELAKLPLEQLITWLTHPSPEMSDLAAELIESAKGVEKVPLDRWLRLVEDLRSELLDMLSSLIQRFFKSNKVSFDQAASMATSRPIPIAQLGMRWLFEKTPTEADIRSLFNLREAQAEPLRPELVRWACGKLGQMQSYQPEWVLEFLDCRHEDVRKEGWKWFEEEPRTADNPLIWQRLLETPYPEIRLRVIEKLQEIAREPRTNTINIEKFSPGLVRFLWASVLLNVHKGSKQKPIVLKHVIERLQRNPHEADDLLPILSAMVRSARGPEFRAGLAGLVGLVERHGDLRPAVGKAFPELKMTFANGEQPSMSF